MKLTNRIALAKEGSKTDKSFLENCVFIGKSEFNINTKPPGT
jgi:hypothetical protein